MTSLDVSVTSLWHRHVSSPGCQDHWSPGSVVFRSPVCWQQRALHLAKAEQKGMRDKGNPQIGQW